MAQQTSHATAASLNLNKLGSYLDGWADLIEGQGEKAPKVKQLVYQFLKERNMPDVSVSQVVGTVGSTAETRPYNITTTHPRATVAIFVGQHGKDLYVSWRAYIGRMYHFRVKLAVIIAAFFGLNAFIYTYQRLTTGLFSFLASGALVNAFSTAVGVAIAILFLEYVFLWWLGYLTKKDGWAYFFVEPNEFDSNDISAMMFAAHKSVLRALDMTGVDTSQLRLKRNFKGGRTDETI